MARPAVDKFDVTSIKWEESTAGKTAGAGQPAGEVPTREIASDMPPQPFQLEGGLSQPPFVEAEAQAAPGPPDAAEPFPVLPEAFAPGKAPLDEAFAEETVFPPSAEPSGQAVLPAPEPPGSARQRGTGAGVAAPEEAPAELQGRTLADLYFAQGHYSEALEIYDELVAAHPFDAELKSLRRDAEARLLPAGSKPGAGGAEPGLQRRLARIRALKEWLSVVQAG